MGNENTIVDVNSNADLSSLEAELQEAVSAKNSAPAAPEGAAPTPAEGEKPAWIEQKFWTGDVEESAAKQHEGYISLQSSFGRMANDLGTQRKLTDRLLDVKRADDLTQNTPEPVALEVDSLLEDPTQALNAYLEPRLSQSNQATEQRLAGIEANLAQQAFVAVHPDHAEIGADPAFSPWIEGSPIRQRAAKEALGGDYSVAAELLTEFKNRAADANTAPATPVSDDVAGARAVGLESSSNAGSTSSGKVYSRSDLIRLRVEKPSVYESPQFQAEIMQAYAEGRVK